MAVYRIYLVHADGRLEPDEAFYCTSDREAVARFRASGAGGAGVRAELWQGGRWVAFTQLGRWPVQPRSAAPAVAA